MNSSSEAADAVIRMYLQGIEMTAKITGAGAKNFAVALYAYANSKHKTKGKIRLDNLLKSGKELKVFPVKKEDLAKFTQEAKRYGILYAVIVDKKNKEPNSIVDVMVKAEDAGKINRIVEKFKLSTVDTLTIKNEITKSLESKKEVSKGKVNPKKALTVKDPLSEHSLENKKVDSTKLKESVKKKLEEAKIESEKIDKKKSKQQKKETKINKSKKIKKSKRKER